MTPRHTGDVFLSTVGRPAARRWLAAASALVVAVPVALGVALSPAAAAAKDDTATRVSSRPPVDRAAPAPEAGVRGVDPTYAPEGVPVAPGALTQALLDASPEGQKFALLPGTHTLDDALELRPRQELHGHAGAVLSGARLLSGFVRTATGWSVGGQTHRFPAKPHGDAPCAQGVTLCNAPEDVFLDDTPLWQVGSLGELRPGAFHFDYGTSTVHLADDPTGRKVEISATAQALHARDGGVVRNLVVEKFGNHAQSGALMGDDLDVLRCVIRLNHGTGVFSRGGLIADNVVVANGQMGLAAGGDDQVVRNNEIAWNNTAGYDPGWEAGGTKWAFSNRLLVEGNWSHDNAGNGLWTDIDNDATTYRNNLVERNAGIGIFHELSYSATIVGNTVRDNGHGPGYFNGRVGINVTDSPRVQVYGNTVTNNHGGSVLVVQDGRTGDGRLGSRTVADVTVRNNVLEHSPTSTGHAGLWVYDDVPNRADYYTQRGIVFAENSYRLPSLSSKLFLGGDAGLDADWAKSWSRWQELGQDVGSTAVTG